ncbi:redox-sensing transcriptional repressor Rex [Nocardia sp. NPDC060256]|uniref:redox-sensing transcriptional repressor Rex n=1 Tax=unclassified Nocardia TaxID=2637762 RepID=UPI003648157F
MTEQHEAPGGVSGRALQKDIPQATVARLATYLRVLATLADEGVAIVSSEELAVAAGVNSAKLRKDLSFLGPNGVRGVGYDVARLRTRIEDVLGLSQGHRVVLVGAGNLGRALVGYGGFQRRGFTVVGIFDNHPEVIGLPVAGLVVCDVAGLAEAVAALEPTIAVITVPDDAAQDACDRLVAAGLQSILSFAPCALIAPATVELRRVDLAVELQMLSFERVRNADNATAAVAAPMGPPRPASSRISHRAPTAHTSAVHQALKHSAAAHTASSHTATEPSSKGSVVSP